MKNLNTFNHSSKESPWDLQLSTICLTSTKRTSNMTKIKNSFTFFLWKTRVEVSKVIANSHKTLGFVTPIPFDSLPRNVLCDLSLMKLGNNWTKKKKKQDYVILVFIEKKFISKDMKAINYKMKRRIGSFILPIKPLRPAIIQNESYVHKKNVKYKKNQILIYFLWKTRVEASKVITNSLKTIDFATPIPFDTFPWQK